MSKQALPHLEFAPPPPSGQHSAWLIAVLAHMVLFAALALATAWKTQPQTLQAEAELWSATPQAAAPKLQEPLPSEPVSQPEPSPSPVPPAVTQAAPPPEPDFSARDAQIALEKKKQQDKKKEEEKAAEAKRKALDKQKKEAQEKAALAKAEKAKKERLQAEREAQKAAQKAKAEADEKKKKQDQARQAAQDKAESARAEALRQENLRRMQGMAGATGGPQATGNALQSSGPSSTYAGRLVGRIKPNITYSGEVAGNPRAEVEVRVAPDGVIQSRQIVRSSGNKAWDDAVLRAIDKTETLPKDTDGRVPPLIVLGFRPLD